MAQVNDRAVPFMVMELMAGQDLRSRIASGETLRLPTTVIVGWTIEILQALEVAHVNSVVHRDLKPENIGFTPLGQIKILDFGVARAPDTKTITQTDTAVGTPAYMSPEHLNARYIGPAADIYSLGVILYEMLSGHVPFEADDALKALMRMMTEDPVPLSTWCPQVESGLCVVVMRMIERDANVRYCSATSVIEVLRPYA